MQINQLTQAPSLSSYIDAIKTTCQEDPEQWLSPSAVADELDMHINTIYRILQSKELPAYDLKVGPSQRTYYRIKRSDLEDWLASRNTKYA